MNGGDPGGLAALQTRLYSTRCDAMEWRFDGICDGDASWALMSKLWMRRRGSCGKLIEKAEEEEEGESDRWMQRDGAKNIFGMDGTNQTFGFQKETAQNIPLESRATCELSKKKRKNKPHTLSKVRQRRSVLQ